MKKNILLLFIGVTVIVSAVTGFSFFIHNALNSALINSLNSKATIREINFMPNYILLSGVNIQDPVNDKEMLRLGKLKVYVSVLEFLKHRDLLSSIKKIEIKNSTLNLRHFEDDKFNIFQLFKTVSNNSKILIPEMHISIKSSDLTYSDKRGFGVYPMKEFVNNTIKSINGDISIISNNAVFSITSTYREHQVNLEGKLEGKDFEMKLTSPKIEYADLINYIGGVKEIDFKEFVSGMDVDIFSVTGSVAEGELPFVISLNAAITNAKLRTDWVSSDVILTQGSLVLNNKGIEIKKVSALVDTDKFEVEGNIESFTKVKLVIRNRKFDTKHAGNYLPFLRSWNLSGPADMVLEITGVSLNDVILKGSVANYKGLILSYQLQDSILNFKKTKNIVELDMPLIKAYEGIGSGNGVVFINNNLPPSINLSLKLREISLPSYFQSKHFLGYADIDLYIDHRADNLQGELKVKGTNASAFGQAIKSVNMLWAKTPQKMIFKAGSFANINNTKTKVYFEGFLDSNFYFDISLKSMGTDINNFYFFYSRVGDYNANVNLSGEFCGYFNEAFKKNPLLTTKGNCKVEVNSMKVNKALSVMTGWGQIKVDKAVYLDFSLANSSANIGILAKASNLGLDYSKFTMNKLPLYWSKPFVKDMKYKYDGVLSGEILLKPGDNKLFIQNYEIAGNISADNLIIDSQNIKQLNSSIIIRNNELLMSKAVLIQPVSTINFDLRYVDTRNFSVIFRDSTIRSSEFEYIPKNTKFKLSQLEGSIVNKESLISANIDFDANSIIYKSVSLPAFKGGLDILNNNILFRNLLIINKTDKYLVSGNIVTDVERKKISKYNLEAYFNNGRLENIADLYQQLKPLWQKNATKQDNISGNKNAVINDYNKVLKNNYVNIYSLSDKNVVNILDSLKFKIAEGKNDALPRVGGRIDGFIKISNVSNLAFNGDLVIEDGVLFNAEFKKLSLLANLRKEDIEININAEKMSALNNNFDKIEFTALYASETAELSVKKLSTIIASQNYDNILQGKINLSPLIFKTEETPSDLKLTLTLEDMNINLLTIFNSSIRKIRNSGNVVLAITGKLFQPVINSREISLNDFSIRFVDGFSLKSPITLEKASIQIVDNDMNLNSLVIHWKGEDTNNGDNVFNINGKVKVDIDLKQFNYLPLGIDLSIEPVKLDINMPDLYIGKVDMERTTLLGTLFMPISSKAKKDTKQNIVLEKESGPVLKASLNFHDGRFIILANRATIVDKPAILIDSSINIDKGLSITGKNFERNNVNNFVTNIAIEMEETNSPFGVKGSLNTIDFENKLKLKSGKIVFMNQVFQLLEKSKQRDIFRSNPEDINDNVVEIRMQPDPEYPTKRKTIPYFNLKAYSNIRREVFDTSNVLVTGNGVVKYVDHTFVIYINGYLNNLKSFAIDHYIFENNTYKIEGERIYLDRINSDQVALMSSYLLPVLLRPQFYQTLLSRGLDNNKEANDLLKSYSASQINLWIDQQLRPFEKEVARSIGLYDLKIEHTIGEEILNSVPVLKTSTQPQIISAESRKVSVEYIKDLFLKKLFVKVKTGINQDPLSNKILYKLTDYELMWLLSDFISINYGNHNMQSNDSVYGAFSINANFDF